MTCPSRFNTHNQAGVLTCILPADHRNEMGYQTSHSNVPSPHWEPIRRGTWTWSDSDRWTMIRGDGTPPPWINAGPCNLGNACPVCVPEIPR